MDRAQDFLLGLIPADVALPAYLPWNVETLVGQVLPRELAVLAGADYASNTLDFVLFLNERRGGPMIVQAMNDDQTLTRVPLVTWDPAGVTLEERGVLTAQGTLPLPEGMEDRVLDLFAPKSGPSPDEVRGGHLLEAVLDNRDGEAMTVVGVIAHMLGANLEQIFAEPTVRNVVNGVRDARIAADITGNDEITVDVEITSTENAGFATRLTLLAAINEVGYEQLQGLMATNGLKLDYAGGKKADWQDSKLKGSFTITGFRAPLDKQVKAALAQFRPA